MGFSPTFRFGNPFFMQPNVDELIWRTQIKNNLSLVRGAHTIKVGGEWMHTLNDQVFRGFFTGRYLFDSVTGSCATRRRRGRRLRPGDGRLLRRRLRHRADALPGRDDDQRRTAAALPAGGGADGPATDAAGASRITNEEFSLFVQDQWQARSNLTLNYGLRWDAQLMPETVDPRTTAYGAFLSDPAFPSDGTIPDQWDMFQPRAGVAWDISGNGRSVVRGSAGVYSARQNMLARSGRSRPTACSSRRSSPTRPTSRRSAPRRRPGRAS